MRHRNMGGGGGRMTTLGRILLALTGLLLFVGVSLMVYFVGFMDHPNNPPPRKGGPSTKAVNIAAEEHRLPSLGGVELIPTTTAITATTSCPTCPQQLQEVVVAHPPTYPFRMRIVVFTYNRINGLKQLLNSLLKADYPTGAKAAGAISLHVFMDFPKKSIIAKAGGGKVSDVLDGTRAYLSGLEWPYGPLEIHRREGNMGLKRSIMEGWYPTKASMGGSSSSPEFCAFFEDDIEVSKHWFTWTEAAIHKYAGVDSGEELGGVGRDSKLLGLSLFRPIKDELSGNMAVVKNDNTPFILQQPCSWGAVYFPWLWQEFREWYADLPPNYDPALEDPSDHGVRPSSNTWDTGSSWKKYLIQIMHNRGWYMVYPNLPDTTVLSTNHLLKGEHPTPPKKYFELPLYSDNIDAGVSLTKLPPLHTMAAYDVMFRSRGQAGPSNLPNYRKKDSNQHHPRH